VPPSPTRSAAENPSGWRLGLASKEDYTRTHLERPLRLLEIDPDLASAIADPVRRREAFKSVSVPWRRFEAGEKLDVRWLADAAPLCVLVLDGFVVRELVSAGRTSADLLGPEDVVKPREAEPGVTLLPHIALWTTMTAARLALIDERFFDRIAAWPEIAAALVERSGRPGQRLVLSRLISTLPSIDARVLASLWMWASHWATVASGGVVLRVPLSHERIARLIGARRPTVTGAVGRLRKADLLAQGTDGSWLLSAPPQRESADEPSSLAMPLLDGMMIPPGLGIRQSTTPEGRASLRVRRELRLRVEEQRQALHMASERHELMIERLRAGSTQLMENSAVLNELAQRRRGRRGDLTPPPGGEGASGKAADE
jgi:CRP/FNR family transcriptional regulator, cyclic AMP receptor protein